MWCNLQDCCISRRIRNPCVYPPTLAFCTVGHSSMDILKTEWKNNIKEINTIFSLEKTCISCQILCFLHCAHETLHFIVWILNIVNNYILECTYMWYFDVWEFATEKWKIASLAKVSIKQKKKCNILALHIFIKAVIKICNKTLQNTEK